MNQASSSEAEPKFKPLKAEPRELSLLTATTVDTAALNFLFALNLLSDSKFLSRPFFAKDSASPRIQEFSSAWSAVNLFLGSTVKRDLIRFRASLDTVPQYSS
mmetsp:Transcript_7981/g.19262  ORF Transcript_7981/g.19262 Transcript_7981/m.19262 type:complete len:103 (+) Transcript_7981:162-470(+)